MKKLILTIACATLLLSGYAQDYKIGLRFVPLNSSFDTHELMSFSPNTTSKDNIANRFDSLAVGLFFEKYFSQKSFLIRVDMNYAHMTVSDIQSSSDFSQWNNTSSDFTDTYKQQFFNINLGIGSHVNWSKFTFNFGAYVPLTIVSKGQQTREANYYNSGELTQKTTGVGSYKPALGIGIGVFGGVSTTLLKHLSIGLDVNYHISYISRSITWHGETYHYQPNVYMTYADEKYKVKNFFTSKITPSIVLAWAFDVKKKPEKVK